MNKQLAKSRKEISVSGGMLFLAAQLLASQAALYAMAHSAELLGKEPQEAEQLRKKYQEKLDGAVTDFMTVMESFETGKELKF